MDSTEPPWELADQFLLIVTDPRHSAARSRSVVAGVRCTGGPAFAAVPWTMPVGVFEPTAGQRPAGVGQSAMRRATAGRILDAWRAGQTVARTEARAAVATSTAMLAQGIGKPTPEAFSSSSFLNSR
jgi:hypothetical protein